MSADGSTGADGGADGAGGDPGAAPAPPSFGTIGEVREALGLDEIEDLEPDERGTETPADEVAAKRDAKGKFVGDAAKAKTNDGAEPAEEVKDDVAIVNAINARSKARRQARAAARLGAAPARAAAPATTAPAASAKPPEAEATAPATAPAPSKEVETAVREVLVAIDRLAAGDAEATTAEQGGNAAAATAAAEERKQALAGVNDKLEALRKTAEVSAEARQQLADLQAEVRAINNDRIIRNRVNEAISAVADDVPTLLDQKAIRDFNKQHGTRYADATDMLTAAALRYHDKFKKAPDLELLAKTIESKLKGASPEKTETDEKPTPTRKTVSRNDGSPPAARGKDDERSFEEATADFNRKYDLDN